MNAIVQHETPRLPAMHSGGAVKAIVPQSMEDAYRLAKAVCAARMAPKGLDTPEACMIAIMHGMEVGLTPMAALQRIAVVNGRPTIWGDGAIGLVRASGLAESIRERIEGEGENLTAICEAKRKTEKEPVVGRFSVADARRAGLWGKQGPWTQYPRRMLQMRARAFALRDGFADVLGGLYLREEIDDAASREMRDVTPPSPPRPPSPQIAPPPAEPEPDTAEIVPETGEATEALTGDEFDVAAYFEEMEASFAAETTAEGVEERWTEFDPEGQFDGDDINLDIAHKIRIRRLAQIHPVNAG